MKVAELTAILNSMPSDAEVLLEIDESDMACDIAGVVYTGDEDDGRVMIDGDDRHVPFVMIQFGMEPREIMSAEEAGSDKE